jgi:two-component system response regulator YesN
MSEKTTPTILVVDDEPGIVELFKECLEDLSFKVEGVTSAQDALEVFRTKNIDCVVTDVSMPVMTGIELAAQIRKLKFDVPLFFMTAYHDHPREELNLFFPKAIIFKPFDFEEAALLVKQHFLRK